MNQGAGKMLSVLLFKMLNTMLKAYLQREGGGVMEWDGLPPPLLGCSPGAATGGPPLEGRRRRLHRGSRVEAAPGRQACERSAQAHGPFSPAQDVETDLERAALGLLRRGGRSHSSRGRCMHC